MLTRVCSRLGKYCEDEPFFFFPFSILWPLLSPLSEEICVNTGSGLASSAQKLISPHADNSCSFSPQSLHSSSSDPVKLPVLYLPELSAIKWDELKNCSEPSAWQRSRKSVLWSYHGGSDSMRTCSYVFTFLWF